LNALLLSSADRQREDAAFPTLNAEEMAAVETCGKTEIYEDGQSLFEFGQQPVDCFVVVSGEVSIIDDSGDAERLIVLHGPGGIVGDISVLSGRPAVVACRAEVMSRYRFNTFIQIAANFRRFRCTADLHPSGSIPALLPAQTFPSIAFLSHPWARR